MVLLPLHPDGRPGPEPFLDSDWPDKIKKVVPGAWVKAYDRAADAAEDIVDADAAYGTNTDFRDGLTALELQYVVGMQSSMTVWAPGKQTLSAKS